MAMDLQTTMERFRELYQEKNDHMQQFLEAVTPYDFYREIFPVGSFERKGHFEDSKGNGIVVTVPSLAATNKHIVYNRYLSLLSVAHVIQPFAPVLEIARAGNGVFAASE